MIIIKYISIRRSLHEIPEIGFAEHKTQEKLLALLATLPQEKIKIEKWRTGIFVHLKGTDTKKPNKMFAFRADMDGLPIEEKTNLPFMSKHKNYMHACGHDLHMTIAYGVLDKLIKKPIKEDVLFIFQPAEEGPGGAKLMCESELYTSFKPDKILALHVAPKYPVGFVATKPDIIFAHTQEFSIKLYGNSSHASEPQLGNDMVLAISALTKDIMTIISRNVDPKDIATICIGKLSAGTKQNIIADQAILEGTIRSLKKDVLTKIKERISAITNGTQTAFNCKAKLSFGAGYTCVKNDSDLVHIFQKYITEENKYKFTLCEAELAGEDFGYFLNKTQGFMFWLGVNSPYPLHHPMFNPCEKAISTGIDIVFKFLHYLSMEKK